MRLSRASRLPLRTILLGTVRHCRSSCLVLACAILLAYCGAAQQVQVLHQEGLVHGFLLLRTLEGKLLADGDLIQNVQGNHVTSRLIFHFKDGSLHDETAVFTQRGHFRLTSDHLVQNGPAFEHPIDMTINADTGQVTVRYVEDGKEKSSTEQLGLRSDISNGLILTLLKNIRPATPETQLAFVAASPKPQLVKLHVTPQGEESFTTGDARRKAMHYVVKIDIGGLKGALASLLGKQPPDTHVWILEGEAPAFVKSEGPLAAGGPVWRIELVSPVFPGSSGGETK